MIVTFFPVAIFCTLLDRENTSFEVLCLRSSMPPQGSLAKIRLFSKKVMRVMSPRSACSPLARCTEGGARARSAFLAVSVRPLWRRCSETLSCRFVPRGNPRASSRNPWGCVRRPCVLVRLGPRCEATTVGSDVELVAL